MEVDQVGSTYIQGKEDIMRGNSIIANVRFKEPLDREALWESYRRFILARKNMRLKWVKEDDSKGYQWVEFDEQEVEELLEKERPTLEGYTTTETVRSEYYPTNTRLPMRLALLDDYTLVVVINHTFATGRAGVYWFEDWLQFYESKSSETPPLLAQRTARKPSATTQLSRDAVGMFWLITYLIKFFRDAGKKPTLDTVDLSHGRQTHQYSSGYSVKSYRLTPEQTVALRKRCRSRGVTVTEHLVEVIAQAMFDLQPDKQRVCISVPVDLSLLMRYVERSRPGNYTSAIIIQLFRNRELIPQIRSQLKWVRRGVPYYFFRLLGWLNTDKTLREKLINGTRLPFTSRGPLEGHTCILSLPGTVKKARLVEKIEWASGHSRTQAPLIAFASIGRVTCMEVSAANDLYKAQEVFAAADKIYAALLS
ncbi:MAG: hypothetical protein R3208_08690 [Ketobacteraceae bacterium]|nr:hypothetical protein [Ketobacteraceae bacterium]